MSLRILQFEILAIFLYSPEQVMLVFFVFS